MTANILIIDDTYEDIVALDRILQAAGYHVCAARDSHAGLLALRESSPELLLLDVMLPNQNGFSVCRQIRSDRNLPNLSIIFVSAVHDVDLKAQAFDAGADDYVTKPFDPKEILLRVRHQLEYARMREELLDNARHDERQHIARELHDSVSQALFVIRGTIQSMMMDSSDLPTEYQKQLTYLNSLSTSALAEMRTLLNELHPSAVTFTSIPKLLHQLVESFGTRLEVEIQIHVVEASLPDTVKHAFYRIAQEALNNVAKYARPTQVSLHFLNLGDGYRLLVKDDGGGFDLSLSRNGMGLESMRERAEQAGMDFKIVSAPGSGTRVEATWIP